MAAQNLTARTVLVHDGVRHALRPLQSGELVAAGASLSETAASYLTDTLRRSNVLQGAPILHGVRPTSTPYDTPFDAQDDGSSLLRLDTEQAAPRTIVLFDSVVLETRYLDTATLAAVVPPGFLANPGRHTVALRDGLGESNTVEFTVTEQATRPPVLRGIEPGSGARGDAVQRPGP